VGDFILMAKKKFQLTVIGSLTTGETVFTFTTAR
jgi:hypothetical protein